MKHIKLFELDKLKSSDEYIKLTAKLEFVLFDGRDGYYYIKKSIPKGQSIFLANYAGGAQNYPYIVANNLPEDSDWKENETFGWISREDIIKYFE